MGELSEETFADWWHPSDVIEHYHQQRELDPRSLVADMLADGLLRAGAQRFILNGRDHGLAFIPRELWPLAAGSEVWSEGRFRFMHVRAKGDITVSAYNVKIDPELQAVPAPAARKGPAKPPAPKEARRGGRPAGTNGEPIARITMRLLAMPPVEIVSYKVESLASDLIAEYRALGLNPPHEDNAKRDASGILRALRERGGS